MVAEAVQGASRLQWLRITSSLLPLRWCKGRLRIAFGILPGCYTRSRFDGRTFTMFYVFVSPACAMTPTLHRCCLRLLLRGDPTCRAGSRRCTRRLPYSGFKTTGRNPSHLCPSHPRPPHSPCPTWCQVWSAPPPSTKKASTRHPRHRRSHRPRP